MRLGPDAEVSPARVAGYIAKYTTKGADALGVLDRRLRSADQLDRLELRPHLHRLVRTAWELGGRAHLAHLRLRAWAHCFGFGGRWLTKSRRYSTTFGALRAARRDYRRRQVWADATPLDAFGRPEADQLVRVVGQWCYAGAGYPTPGDRWLALAAAARAREQRQAAHEHRHTNG
ncbi:MAG TPA: replication initiator [Frankiaceae bacterium]|nr:replication initiator [Frankiaceae bacterium]